MKRIIQKLKYYLVPGIMGALFFTSCVTTQQATSNRRLNLNFLYNPNAQNIHANVIAHNLDNNSTLIYCQIPSKDLMFLPNGESSSCNLTIRYTLYETSQGLK